MNPEKSLFLIRGLPGAGKTTVTKSLAENGRYPIFSIDDYFVDPKTKEYNFDYRQNHLAYKNCEENTRKALEKGISKVFVDNTFTLSWEMEPYFQLASNFQYVIFVLTVENYHGGKNIHSIEIDQLKKMASKYRVQLLPKELQD
ncbi:AAA family ATPase [Leptospira sp. WS92.C1]